MIDLAIIAPEVHRILRTFRCELKLYDPDGNQVYQPEKASRFFDTTRNIMVSLVDDGDNSGIEVHLSQSVSPKDIQGMVKTLRTCATKYGLLAHQRKWDKQLAPKDFAHGIHESAGDTMMDLTEQMYGTTKSSYLKLENAKMIVRHRAPVNEEVAGSRSRRIDRIFVENKQGERFLMPTGHLSAGRAMVQHLNNLGEFADTIGAKITNMARDYKSLADCSSLARSHASSLADPDAAHQLREDCRSCRGRIRKTFERVYRNYERESARLAECATLSEDTQAAISERAEQIRKALACEGVDLDDKLVESVARSLCEYGESLTEAEAEADDLPGDDPSITPKRGEVELIGGYVVNENAWNAFLTGKDQWEDKNGETKPLFNGEPDYKGAGFRFESKRDELVARLVAVNNVVNEPGLANFLGYVADTLDTSTELTKLTGLLVRIAKQAINLGGLPMTESFSTANPAIREYMEWLKSMSPDAVLVEASSDGCEEIEEDVEISREDVILPKDPTKDLETSVTKNDAEKKAEEPKAKPQKGHEPTDPETGKKMLFADAETRRLRELAGLKDAPIAEEEDPQGHLSLETRNWIREANAYLKQHYAIDFYEGGADEEELVRAAESGDTPKEYAEWWAEKYDLDRVSGPWGGL